jgi:glycosyltransferase involved in cell wall biosynthesis
MPEITVLMPVYNAERFLRKALESVLIQGFKDFELLIINDGSTDRSAEIIDSFKDPRIKMVYQENRGVAEALKVGVEIAQGKYLARMDADDESLPNRLALQKKLLDEHPDTCLVYGMHELIDTEGKTVRSKCGRYLSDNQIKWMLLWGNAITHPTVMIRLQILRKYGINYRPETNGAEDFDLWNRLADKGKFLFLSEVVLRYRMNPASVNRVNRGDRQLRAYRRVIQENFIRYGIPLTLETAEELAVISGQTRENPLTFSYRFLPNEIFNLFQIMVQKYIEKTGAQVKELYPEQAKQLGRWARNLLHRSHKTSKSLLVEALKIHPYILFERAFLLTLLSLFLPKAAIQEINKGRTRPLY